MGKSSGILYCMCKGFGVCRNGAAAANNPFFILVCRPAWIILSAYLIFPLYRHSIQSNVWNQFSLQHCTRQPCDDKSSIQPITISMAIHNWMEATKIDPRKVVQYRDACQGAYCNSQCPEEVVLGALGPYWSLHYQIIVVVAVVGVSVACIAVKLWIMVRHLKTKRSYSKYLKEKAKWSITGVSEYLNVEL